MDPQLTITTWFWTGCCQGGCRCHDGSSDVYNRTYYCRVFLNNLPRVVHQPNGYGMKRRESTDTGIVRSGFVSRGLMEETFIGLVFERVATHSANSLSLLHL